MPNVKDWRKDISAMSNGGLDALAGIVRLELGRRVNDLHEKHPMLEVPKDGVRRRVLTWEQSLEAMSNEQLEDIARVIIMGPLRTLVQQETERREDLEKMDKVPEWAKHPARMYKFVEKAWFKEICPNKHQDHRIIYLTPGEVVKQCHSCGATAPLGSDEWTRSAMGGKL